LSVNHFYVTNIDLVMKWEINRSYKRVYIRAVITVLTEKYTRDFDSMS